MGLVYQTHAPQGVGATPRIWTWATPPPPPLTVGRRPRGGGGGWEGGSGKGDLGGGGWRGARTHAHALAHAHTLANRTRARTHADPHTHTGHGAEGHYRGVAGAERTSAVQHKMGAPRFTVKSPVIMPTCSGPKSLQSCRNFSLTRALMGHV